MKRISCSIILPSRNGADTLPITLAALSQLEGLHADNEIILVDNASMDSTPKLMHQFAQRTGAQFIEEPRPGKSYALNRAIGAASGELLIFMDDDVTVSKNWLRAFQDAAEAFPEIGAFAGQVRPRWAAEPPDWLRNLADMGRACGCTSIAASSGPFRARDVKGANIAVRRSILGALRFDVETTNYGASSRPIGGEDTRLMNLLEQRGNQIFYVREAVCDHYVPAAEMSLRNVFNRYVRIGRSSAANGPQDSRTKLRAWIDVPSSALMAIRHLALLNRTQAANWMISTAMALGKCDYFRNRSKISAPSSH